MASFRSCITEALQKGEIDQAAADMASEAYDDAFASASETLGPIEADRTAAQATMAKLEAEAIEARRRRQAMVRTRRAALETIAGLKTRRGYEGVQVLGGGDGSGKPPKGGWVQGGTPPPPGQPYGKGAMAALGLKRMVENRPGPAAAPGPSMAGRYRYVRGRFDAQMASLIEAFETRTGFDAPNRAHLANFVREAFGEDTGDKAAKGLAEAWGGTSETARKQFNAAGGAIGKMDRWGLPQMWDRARVRDVGQAAWVDAILPRLDRAKMVDRMTGQPFTDKRLKAVLGETWASIATGGASKRSAAERLGSGMVAKQRGEERFLMFRSADDWMAAQKDFGEGDAFQAMMGHLDDMAIDIAQMEILGPNPRHQFDWLAAFAKREAALEEAGGAVGAVDRAEGLILEAQRMYDHFAGDLNVPVNTTLAQAGSGTRAFLTGAMLGSAVLGEIGTAPGLGRMARGFVGLSRNGDMGELMRLIADPAERAIARRTGFIIETAMDGFVRGSHDNLRLISVGARAESGMNAFSRRLPSAVIRVQGLSGLVAARKRSFRNEFMGMLHDVRDRSLSDLKAGDRRDQVLAKWLDDRGFTEADWTVIRTTPAWEPRRGAAFLLPGDVGIPELGARLGEGIDMETRMLSPETTLEARSWWTTARPGTFVGELQRSTGMFKGFTATLTTLYAENIALQGKRQAGNALVNMAGMATTAVIFMTLGGAVNVQLREMLKGNDPRPMDDPKFWGAALAQGGGLGIAGDFLYAAEARNGKTAPVAAFGPVGQLASDAWGLTGGNALAVAGGLADGEDLGEAAAGANIGRDAARFAATYNPLASLWWSRAAFSRIVADNLQRALDPEAQEAFERRAKRMQRETGQGQWWPQGSSAPERLPDVGTAMSADD